MVEKMAKKGLPDEVLNRVDEWAATTRDPEGSKESELRRLKMYEQRYEQLPGNKFGPIKPGVQWHSKGGAEGVPNFGLGKQVRGLRDEEDTHDLDAQNSKVTIITPDLQPQK